MKKLLCIIAATLFIISGCSEKTAVNTADESEEFNIAASFYPIYIAALNIAGGVEGVRVNSLVSAQTGCLHDYALTVEEMKIAESSDVLIINGAGMEPFMDKISSNIPSLEVIDASANIEKISTDGVENPHVWLDAENAILQAQAIADGLCRLRPEYAGEFRKNAEKYISALEELDEELMKNLEPVSGAKLVTFHEAFEYFAHAYGLEVAASVRRDEHSSPSPSEIEDIISVMEEGDIEAIFSEPQYQDSVVETIAQATDAKVYTLDPIVGGEISAQAYINAMRKNAQTLLAAFE